MLRKLRVAEEGHLSKGRAAGTESGVSADKRRLGGCPVKHGQRANAPDGIFRPQS